MTRWTLLAIGLVVAGCSEGDKDQVQREGSEAAATADTALRSDQDTAATAASGEARPEAERAAKPEAAPAKPEAPAADRGPTGAEAMGAVQSVSGPRQLSADQVRRLQVALNDDGCEAGPADGVLGARTREAIACGMRKHKLRGNDMSGLYRALDLDF